MDARLRQRGARRLTRAVEAEAAAWSTAPPPPVTSPAEQRSADEIASALDRPDLLSELFLEYQPIYTLATAHIERVEALLRWRHPRWGVVAPLQFVPHAERTGRIEAIGRWVLETACRQVAAWNRRLRPHAPLVAAVNVSACQLANPHFAGDVRAALARAELDPTLLLLEVTESSAVATGHVDALRNLETARELGVRIAIDDFGTGYSSLEYLGRLPVDAVKIDRVFVERLADPRGRSLFNGIVDLARALDLETIAEGIESEEELRTVVDSRCAAAQGYLLSRPHPATAIAHKLGTRPHPTRQRTLGPNGRPRPLSGSHRSHSHAQADVPGRDRPHDAAHALWTDLVRQTGALPSLET